MNPSLWEETYKLTQSTPLGAFGETSRSHRNLCVSYHITVACTEREVPRSKEHLAWWIRWVVSRLN